MTTVTGKLIGAASPQRVEMKAFLVDVTGKDAIGYVASVPGEVVRPVPITAESDGDWTAVLTANSLIQSDAGDTLWAIQEGRAKDGTPILTYVVVPATGGPYWAGEIRADLTDTITGGGTVVYLPGPQGATGPTGATGAAGADGEDGEDGDSAYEVAVTGGFVGSEAEWLASLVGPEGEQGPEGPQPALGAAGAGADIALRSTDPTTTNARTPTAHATSHASGGTDPVTPAAIGADPAGTATTAVAAHAADTIDVHGIADTSVLETTTGSAAKVSTHAVATDPHGDRSWADSKFATITNLGVTNAAVADLDGFVQDCLARVSAIENGTAWLSGLNVAGNAQVSGGDLTVADTAKGYRFRRGGSALDLEATGGDLILSNWSGTGFNGTQYSFDRYASNAHAAQHAGLREFVSSLYGAVVHTIDPNGNKLGFHGKTPVSQQAVTGSRADGTALMNLLAALDALGLIDDQTTS